MTEHLRTGLDLLNLFFIIDEYTDVQPAHVVREMMAACIDAMHNPAKPRPEGEVVLAEMVRQYVISASHPPPFARTPLISLFKVLGTRSNVRDATRGAVVR